MNSAMLVLLDQRHSTCTLYSKRAPVIDRNHQHQSSITFLLRQSSFSGSNSNTRATSIVDGNVRYELRHINQLA